MTDTGIGACVGESPMQGFSDTRGGKTYVDPQVELGSRVHPSGYTVSPEDGAERVRNGTVEYGLKHSFGTSAPPSTFNVQRGGAETTAAAGVTSVSASATEDYLLNASMTDSISSLTSRLSYTRRRRRQEHVLLEDTGNCEEQRHELERILKSLEEMQQENKNRMRKVTSHLCSTRPHFPNENAADGTQCGQKLFFRSQSVSGQNLCGVLRGAALERAMTSLTMPEPSLVTPTPLPWRRSRGSPPAAAPATTSRTATAWNSHMPQSHQTDSLTAAELATEKSSVRKGSTDQRGSGGGKLHPPARSNGATEVTGGRGSLASSERNKKVKPVPSGSKKFFGGMASLARPSGRSVSPQIIILTVDSRRNMGEEDARRLLSAEPVRAQDSRARLCMRDSEGRTSGSPSQPKHAPEVVMRSPNAKEQLAAPSLAGVKERLELSAPPPPPPPPPKKSRPPASLVGNAFGSGAEVGADGDSAGKKEGRNCSDATTSCNVLYGRVSNSKTRGSIDAQVSSKEVRRTKSLLIDSSMVDTHTSTTRPVKRNSVSSKPIHVLSGEQKHRLQMKLDGCGRSADSESQVPWATAGPARRRTAGDERLAYANSRRDELLTVQGRLTQGGVKDALPLQKFGASPSVSQRTNGQNVPSRQRSLSMVMNAAFIERDMCRPLATDRPSAARPRTLKQASSAEPQTGKQLVPFCTECGKRHIDGKAKFCAFCGHKRETV